MMWKLCLCAGAALAENKSTVFKTSKKFLQFSGVSSSAFTPGTFSRPEAHEAGVLVSFFHSLIGSLEAELAPTPSPLVVRLQAPHPRSAATQTLSGSQR